MLSVGRGSDTDYNDGQADLDRDVDISPQYHRKNKLERSPPVYFIQLATVVDWQT
jgi:hypothetical protein